MSEKKDSASEIDETAKNTIAFIDEIDMMWKDTLIKLANELDGTSAGHALRYLIQKVAAKEALYNKIDVLEEQRKIYKDMASSAVITMRDMSDSFPVFKVAAGHTIQKGETR